MTSKLRKAIGAVKDHTSIGLAKVSSNNAASLEVAILKATTHEETPIDEKYIKEILQVIASDKVYAAACAHVIAKRIGKTKTWTVAIKALMLVLRIFQDGDPYFPKEVLHAMKRGAKILNLSSFRDDSNSPWDYTAFVRIFALYLDERLDCFLTGKLQKRYTHKERDYKNKKSAVTDMKPAMLLDKMFHWQRLLDRAIVTRPSGVAKTNRLVQIAVHAVVQETFGLYEDISDGLAFLLDSFFHLQYQSCVVAYQCCLKANKQFEELISFYDMCRSHGIGRTSEYPSVQKISEELLDTLREFLKDQASLPANGSTSPGFPPMPPGLKASQSVSSSVSLESYDDSTEPNEKFSEKGSEYGSACTSLEDLMNSTDFGTSPSHVVSTDQDDRNPEQSQQGEMNASTATGSTYTSPPPSNQPSSTYKAPIFVSFDEWPQSEDTSGDNRTQKQEQIARSSVQPSYSYPNFASFDDLRWKENQKQEEQVANASNSNSREGWELALLETATQPPSQSSSSQVLDSGFQPFNENAMFDNPSVPQHYNPFLDDAVELANSIPTTSATHQPTFSGITDQVHFAGDNVFSAAPTFQATPTFSAQDPNQGAVALEHDPFETFSTTAVDGEHNKPSGNVDPHRFLSEQQMWLQNQNKIISKRFS